MKVYIINRGGVDLQVQLSDEEAKRLGVTPLGEKVKKPANKAKAVASK